MCPKNAGSKACGHAECQFIGCRPDEMNVGESSLGEEHSVDQYPGIQSAGPPGGLGCSSNGGPFDHIGPPQADREEVCHSKDLGVLRRRFFLCCQLSAKPR